MAASDEDHGILKVVDPVADLYITVDGGKNWKKLGKEDGIPDGNLGRIGIAFATQHAKKSICKSRSNKKWFL